MKFTQMDTKGTVLSAKRKELPALSRQPSAPDSLLLAAYCYLPTSFPLRAWLSQRLIRPLADSGGVLA